VLLIVETSLAYGRQLLRGIGRYAVARESWSLYVDLRELMATPQWLDSWRGDGIICRATTPELAAQLKRKRLPTVDLADVHGDLGLPHIWTDNATVGRLAATHLLERGFRQFGFCGFLGHDWARRRREGFTAALQESGCSADILELPWETTRKHSWEQQQQEIAAWLARLPKPVGVLAANDMRGQHVLDACRRHGLAVPEEVAVIGVDNDELLCQLCDPPLSSVAPNPERIGYDAAALLDRLMQGEKPTEREWLIPPLGVVTRQSSDVLAIDDPLVSAAVRLIRERACARLSVDDVLKAVPLSRSVLERRFRKYLQRSPQEEIRWVQLKRVKQLLAETDLALANIADLAGYDHAEYLSVVFKRETGQTPGEYRRQVQAGQER
jgi:LacI family transcriptional regulator